MTVIFFLEHNKLSSSSIHPPAPFLIVILSPGNISFRIWKSLIFTKDFSGARGLFCNHAVFFYQVLDVLALTWNSLNKTLFEGGGEKKVLTNMLTNKSLFCTIMKLNTEILVLFKLIILLLAHELKDLGAGLFLVILPKFLT